jgi:two-component system sensor histidine kinase KdpD
MAYKGQTVEEMDLAALLIRRPSLALIDELAHTNAPDSKHPKRWQDVEDLLAAGIDVYTTLNIQHVESLNDIVAQITRIRVRETVPDLIIDRADDIEVIDLTPDDLIKRLKEGKVYVPKTAERALEHYFSAGNLTALRELALRRTAQRVDEQLLTHMQAHAISGPWAAGERVLVCISEDARSAGLVRYAKRLADRLHAPWVAVTVESGRSASLSEDQRDRVADALRLADRLRGEVVTIPGSGRIADDVISYAQEHNVTQIVIGKTSRSRWFELLHGSVVHDLVRRAGNISVHVIAGEEAAPAGSMSGAVHTAPDVRKFNAYPYGIALCAVAFALGLAKIVEPIVGVETVDLLFLTGVVAVAVQFGLYPSLVAVAAASLAYNFFFLPPLYTFTVSDPTNVASLILFAIVAVLVSNLASRVRVQVGIARNRAKTTESLYGFSRKLTTCTGLDDVLWATAFQMASLLDSRVVLLLPDDNAIITVRAGYPPEDSLEAADVAAAKVAFDSGAPAGRGADTLPGAKRLFLPIRSNRGTIGIVGLESNRPGPILSPEQRRLFDALSDQAALAIQQVQLLADLDRAKLNAETDRLRQALLTSISHDLRTPLAAIIGSAGTLRDFDQNLDAATKADLLRSIQDESERLYRFIANLLDMTRLESGAVVPNRSANEVGEIVGSALRRALKSWLITRSNWISRPICRWSTLTPCCLSRFCSTFSTTRRNTLHQAQLFASKERTAPVKTMCRFRSWTRAAESMNPISIKFLRNFIARVKATASAPALAWGYRCAEGSSRPWEARSLRATGPTALARCSH